MECNEAAMEMRKDNHCDEDKQPLGLEKRDRRVYRTRQGTDRQEPARQGDLRSLPRFPIQKNGKTRKTCWHSKKKPYLCPAF